MEIFRLKWFSEKVAMGVNQNIEQVGGPNVLPRVSHR